jgi:cytochrome P450
MADGIVDPKLTAPPHVPPELVRPYPFRRGRFTERKAHDLVQEVHAAYPEAFFVEDIYPGKSGWVFRRARDIRDIFFDTDHFTSSATNPFASLTGGGWQMIPVEVDPPNHTSYRAIFNPLFTPKRMAALEGQIREIARDYIAAFRQRGNCEFVTEFGREFPIKVFLLLMGLPLDQTDQFMAWEKVIVSAGSLEEVRPVALATVAYLREAIADRRQNPREDLITYAVQAELRGRTLTAEELLGFCVTIFVAGLDTVASHLGHMFRHLAENPDQQATLRAHPEMIPDAVDELMRAFAAVTIMRTCAKEKQVGGVTVKPGDRVALSLPLAGRDPEAYERPNEIVLNRKPDVFSFGQGAHLCLGVHLARRELRIALEEFLAEVPQFRLAPDAKIVTDLSMVVQLVNLPLVWDV